MVTSADVEGALRGVIDPELGGDIVELGMLRGSEIDGTTVRVDIALTIAACPLRDQIEGDVVRKISALPGVDEVEVRIAAMTDRQRSELMSVARRMARDTAEPTMIDPTTRVIAVSSGKGGVGKSTVSVNLAVALTDAGFRVGLLDADIWGFSVPRMLGADGRLEAGEDRKIVPIEAGGIQLVSTGLLVDDEDRALMWRGLMLSKALEQFLHDVAWDPALDYLVIDMPPGTGDIQMALARLLPQAEMVVVTTPQQTAQKVAARVADMARRSYIPAVGVVENMSGGVFGEGGGADLADDLGVPLIGSIPLDPLLVTASDDGDPVARDHPEAPAASAFAATALQVAKLVPPADQETCTARIAVLIEQLATAEATAS